MPHTLKYRELIDELISSDRITTYANVFAPPSDCELVGVYLWNKQVAANLLPLASAIEVSTRNQLDRALVARLGQKWWKQAGFQTKNEVNGKPAHFIKQWVIDAFDAAGRQFGKEQEEIHGPNLALHAQMRHGDYIARQDMVTWQHLLDKQFNPLLWPTAIGDVFKGPAPVKTVTDKQNFARTQLIAIRKLRNRIAHNEPVWKTATAVNETDALKALNDRIASMETFLTFIDPELHRMMTVNGFISAAKRLASVNAIRHAQHQLAPKMIKSVKNLGQIVDACALNNEMQPAVMVKGNRTKFAIIPR